MIKLVKKWLGLDELETEIIRLSSSEAKIRPDFFFYIETLQERCKVLETKLSNIENNN